MKDSLDARWGFVGLSLIVLCCTSCINTKKVTYFNDITDTTLISIEQNLEPVIQKSDVLSISVSSITPEVAVVFNTPNTAAGASSLPSGNLLQADGYLVNQDGYIQFPMLGDIKVAGLTKKLLKEELTNRLKDKRLLFDPIVNIRYLNFHVTVLGEVNRPGEQLISNEQVTVLEAIGMAGDLTIYGKRDNVLLIRKTSNGKLVRRLNLSSPQILSSPYYYLRSNDVIYVEPNKNKVASASQGRQVLPTILSGLSLLVIVLDRVIK